MELTLEPERVQPFEARMDELSPWMHCFKFGEQIYTGYYKYEGLGNLTCVHRRSDPADIARMREAYAKRDRTAWREFLHALFERVAPDVRARSSMRLLDVASATGQVSLMAVDAGFGRVLSSEIRPEQVAQQELILSSLADSKYRNAIEVVHDQISADVEAFPERYLTFQPDVVCSFGLLYHLANPVQHLMNLRAISRRYVLIYTMVHLNPLAKRMWTITLEDAAWMTKAVAGVSWTPHLLELARVARAVGFRTVTPVYPAMFHKHFRDYDPYTRMTDAKLLAEMAAAKLFRLKIGSARNNRPDYFRHSGMSPAYFGYVMEKA